MSPREPWEDLADAMRSRIPQPPREMDERVLAAIEAERATTASSLPRGTLAARLARGSRLRSSWPLRAVAAAVAAASLVAAVFAVRPAFEAEQAEATVPIIPLTADCPREGGPLVVAGVWHGPEARRFAQVLERFERRSGHQVSFAYETREIAAKLESRIERGCAPDVALLPQPGTMADLARHSRIRPLDDIVGAQVAANYSDAWRQLGTVDGKLFGVWFKAADKSTFWYRPEAFRRAGIKRPPRTWTELIVAARRLRAAGIDPVSVAGADGWTLTDWFENVYLRRAGTQKYDELAAHRIRWTDASVKQALRTLGGLFGDESLVGVPTRARATTFEESVDSVFGPGATAGMVYEADFVRSFLPPAPAARGAGAGATVPHAEFFRFPGFAPGADKSAIVGGDVAVLFSDSEAARELIRFLATPEAAEPWVRAGGFVSPNAKVPARAYRDPLTRRTAAALTGAGTVRFDLSDLQPPAFGAREEQGMREILQDFLADPADVDGVTRRLEAAAKAAGECERAIGGKC